MTVAESKPLSFGAADVTLLKKYLSYRDQQLGHALTLLRSEREAVAFCSQLSTPVGATTTRNREHHQSSKAMVAAVTAIAEQVSKRLGFSLVSNPQTRCVWSSGSHLHVTARNLDGAIPSLANPIIVWEIKEYWGTTGGGSKMSDAVYECCLVGRELRDFEASAGISIGHIVFIDGQEQWKVRKSDLARFIDLLNQGLIDLLIVGREVETAWSDELAKLLNPHKSEP